MAVWAKLVWTRETYLLASKTFEKGSRLGSWLHEVPQSCPVFCGSFFWGRDSPHSNRPNKKNIWGALFLSSQLWT